MANHFALLRRSRRIHFIFHGTKERQTKRNKSPKPTKAKGRAVWHSEPLSFASFVILCIILIFIYI